LTVTEISRTNISNKSSQKLPAPHILVDDLSLFFSRYEAQGLLPPEPSFLTDEIITPLEQKLRSHFNEVSSIKGDRMLTWRASEILKEMAKLKEGHHLYVLSLCKYTPSNQNAFPRVTIEPLEYSRGLLPTTGTSMRYNEHGLVPRKQGGRCLSEVLTSLETEIRHHDQQLKRSKLMVVDDTIFTGGTVHNVLLEIQKNTKLPVHIVYAYIAKKHGLEALKKTHPELCIQAGYEAENPENIINASDVFTAGRRVTIGNDNYSALYILPFGQLDAWMGISGDFAYDFSRFCLEKSADIFSYMSELNGRDMTFSELGLKLVVPYDYNKIIRACPDLKDVVQPTRMDGISQIKDGIIDETLRLLAQRLTPDVFPESKPDFIKGPPGPSL